MGRRLLAWLCVTPLAAAGVLAGHALAYRATGSPVGTAHEYLAHAPQVALVLAAVGLAGLALQQRLTGVAAARLPYALVGSAAFAVQEHLERALHDGSVPWLLTDRTFLVGLALQVPVALASLALARRLVRELVCAPASGPALLPSVTLAVGPAPELAPRGRRPARAVGRAPPALLRA